MRNSSAKCQTRFIPLFRKSHDQAVGEHAVRVESDGIPEVGVTGWDRGEGRVETQFT